jgi:nitroreductase
MDLVDAIKGRRSIRKYQNKDISDDVIKQILDLAIHAPSSMNGQPWYFIVVRDNEMKKRLVEIKNRYCPAEKSMFRADFLQDAPVVIVVCVDIEKSYDRELENAVLATANIMLGAFHLLIGSVYMSACKTDDAGVSEEIRKILDIPPNIAPMTIIPLGYPDETPETKEVKTLEEVVFHEAFGKR